MLSKFLISEKYLGYMKSFLVGIENNINYENQIDNFWTDLNIKLSLNSYHEYTIIFVWF